MSAYLTCLSNESLIHFQGPDTATFLQGQVTCDVRKVSESNTLAGAYCTPKGRVIVDFLLGQAGPNHWLMRVRKDASEHTAETLSKYIVFSKSDLESQRTDWVVLGCWLFFVHKTGCCLLPASKRGSKRGSKRHSKQSKSHEDE